MKSPGSPLSNSIVRRESERYPLARARKMTRPEGGIRAAINKQQQHTLEFIPLALVVILLSLPSAAAGGAASNRQTNKQTLLHEGSQEVAVRKTEQHRDTGAMAAPQLRLLGAGVAEEWTTFEATNATNQCVEITHAQVKMSKNFYRLSTLAVGLLHLKPGTVVSDVERIIIFARQNSFKAILRDILYRQGVVLTDKPCPRDSGASALEETRADSGRTGGGGWHMPSLTFASRPPNLHVSTGIFRASL